MVPTWPRSRVFLLDLAPGTQFVDVCHTISPQNILEGGFVLAGIVDVFPKGTVHLAVIDPGVGTDRRLIAVSVADQWFVLPDNGLITGVVRGRKPSGIWEITNPALRRSVVSATFHGRDILAPASAHLIRGGDPSELGPALEKFITLRNFVPNADEHGFVGEVIFRDAFGNLITNINADHLANVPADGWVIEIAGERIRGFCGPMAIGRPDRWSPWWAARAGSKWPWSTAMRRANSPPERERRYGCAGLREFSSSSAICWFV